MPSPPPVPDSTASSAPPTTTRRPSTSRRSNISVPRWPTPRGRSSVTFNVTGATANDVYRVTVAESVTDIATNALDGEFGGSIPDRRQHPRRRVQLQRDRLLRRSGPQHLRRHASTAATPDGAGPTPSARSPTAWPPPASATPWRSCPAPTTRPSRSSRSSGSSRRPPPAPTPTSSRASAQVDDHPGADQPQRPDGHRLGERTCSPPVRPDDRAPRLHHRQPAVGPVTGTILTATVGRPEADQRRRALPRQLRHRRQHRHPVDPTDGLGRQRPIQNNG